MKEFTHDSQFQNLRKTYDEDIAYKKEKMLRGLVQKGHDPLAQLAMSKEMLRYHQELEAVRSKGMRVHEFEDLRKKKRKKKKRKRKDKRKHKHKKSSSSKKRKKKRKRKSLRSSGSGSSDHSESDSDSSNSSSEDSNDSDTKRYKKKKMRQQQKREMANAAASARAAALRARAEKAEAEADAERQAKKEEEVREKQKRELELQKQRTKYMEEQKKLCEEAFAARPAYLVSSNMHRNNALYLMHLSVVPFFRKVCTLFDQYCIISGNFI